jgi:hypothetical protein
LLLKIKAISNQAVSYKKSLFPKMHICQLVSGNPAHFFRFCFSAIAPPKPMQTSGAIIPFSFVLVVGTGILSLVKIILVLHTFGV